MSIVCLVPVELEATLTDGKFCQWTGALGKLRLWDYPQILEVDRLL